MIEKLEKYVHGVCTDEERNVVRAYIMKDFYNAFDVIEMMRDRAHDELAPVNMVQEEVILENHDMPFFEDSSIFDVEAMPCVRSIPIDMVITSAVSLSILDMLNEYLLED